MSSYIDVKSVLETSNIVPFRCCFGVSERECSGRKEMHDARMFREPGRYLRPGDL